MEKKGLDSWDVVAFVELIVKASDYQLQEMMASMGRELNKRAKIKGGLDVADFKRKGSV